jgi:hypothetical protein
LSLLLFVHFGLVSRVRAVMQAGANCKLTNHGWARLQRASRNGPEARAACVEYAEHCDITDDNKNYLLLWFARFNLASRVRAVLQAGANAAYTEWGKTALILACEYAAAAAAAELMEATKRAGALDLKATGSRTALHVASAGGQAGTVAKLLALGADAALTDKDGYTPFELARLNLPRCREVITAFAEYVKHSDMTDDNKNEFLFLCVLARDAPTDPLYQTTFLRPKTRHYRPDSRVAALLSLAQP